MKSSNTREKYQPIKIPSIPKEMYDCGGKRDRCLLKGENTACMKHLNKWYSDIVGETPPSQKKQVQEKEELKKIEKAVKEGFEESEKHLKENPNYPYPQEEVVKKKVFNIKEFIKAAKELQKAMEEEGWEKRCRTSEFGFDTDASKLIPFIKSLLSSQRQKYIEAISKMKDLHFMKHQSNGIPMPMSEEFRKRYGDLTCGYCAGLSEILALILKKI